MEKHKHKNLSIEKAMRTSVLPSLPDHDIQSAQKRVWNQISASIATKPQSLDIPRPSFFSVFVRTSKYALAYLMLFVMLMGSIFYMYTVILTTNQDVVPEVAKSDSQIEAEKIDLQALAASRFQELNGITFEEYKEVIEVTEQADEPVFIPTPQTEIQLTATPKPTEIVKIDTEKAQEVVKKIEDKDLNLFYTEKTLKVLDKELYINTNEYIKLPKNIDLEKEINLKNWSRLNFYKAIISQEDSIKKFDALTPNGTIEYYGGKYAIQTSYKKEVVQIAGVTTEGKQVLNPETELLKNILQDRTAKAKEIKKVNDREILVVEVNKLVSETDKTTKIIYELSKENLSILKETHYAGDKAIFELATIATTEQKVKDINDVINANELDNKQIELKKFELSESPQFFEFKQSKLNEYSKEYSIFSLSNSSIDTISRYSFFEYTSDELQKYREFIQVYNSKDFIAESGVEFKSPISNENALANQFMEKDISITVYDLLPKSYQEIDPTLLSQLILTIDTQKIDATLRTQRNSRVLYFQFHKNFYVFIENANADSNYKFTLNDKTGITLVTEEKLLDVNKYIEGREVNTPKYKVMDASTMSIPEVSKLRNDLKTRLKAKDITLNQFTKKSTETLCDKFFTKLDKEIYLNCFAEKNSGFIVQQSINGKNENFYIFYKTINKDTKDKFIKDNKLNELILGNYIIISEYKIL